MTLVAGADYMGGPAQRKHLLAFFGDEASLRSAFVSWWVFGALLVAALLVQPRWPLVALALAVVGGAAHRLEPRLGIQPLDLAVPVVLFLVTSHARTRWLSACLLAVVAAGDYVISVIVTMSPPGPAGKTIDSALVAGAKTGGSSLPEALVPAAERSFQVLLVLGLAVALGDSVRSRRQHLRLLEERAADLERRQHQQAALASAAERSRISREIHDVVGHGLSVIVVQAQGAAAAMERHPARAAEAIQHVIGTGRASLAEMRRLLGVIRRDPADDGAPVPEPGVNALTGLIEQVRAAGLTVTLQIDGEPVPLPATVDLSAYRIVQEALTNTLRHVGAPADVSVRLAFTGDSLEVRITDDGPGGTAAAGAGHGLRGIMERVDQLGGEFVAGPAGEHGFEVLARLPIGAAR